MRIEVITNVGALLAIRSEWEKIWEDCPEASPFQHPSWLLSWWDQFGAGKRLFTLTFRSGELHWGLSGIVPLCILSQGGLRKIMPIGVGLSDYLDGLFTPDVKPIAAEVLLKYLIDHCLDWDECELLPLPANSALLQPTTLGEILSVIEPVDTLTSLKLPCNPANQSISSHFADRLKEARSRADRLGRVQFKTERGPLISPAMDYLMKFRQRRWNNHSPYAQRFFLQTATEFAKRGELRLYSLSINDRIVSTLYGFEQRGRGYLYLTGFDPDFKRISPGVLILAHALESLTADGVSQCEFLRGREAYKYRWRIEERSTYVRRLKPPRCHWDL